jgi:hypothetical protein
VKAVSLARGLCFASFGLAAVAGSLIDEAPARPREERAGYRVLEADLHVHTRFSDGLLTPCDLAILGRRRGLDVIAVTEHNTVFPAYLARACAALIAGAPAVVVGEEITTKGAHLLALGLERAVDARQPLAESIADAHRQGALVIAAHPTERFYAALDPVCAELDGVEIMHPLAYRSSSPIGSYAEIRAFAERCPSARTLVGSSDYHGGSVLGLVRTFVFVDGDGDAAFIDALRRGRSVSFDPDGVGLGPPELVKALVDEPLADRGVRYDYQPLSLFDRVTRLLGFVALLGIVALRPAGARAT